MSKIKAKGVIIKYGDTATPTTTFPQLSEISYDNGAWERLDTTAHDTSGDTTTHVKSMKAPSSIAVRAFFDPADTAHAWLVAAADGIAAKYMTFILPDAGAAQWALLGDVMNFNLGPLNPKGMVEVNFNFESNSAHTFTA